jgi:hypothetical protein
MALYRWEEASMDFLSLDKFITPSLIRILYIIGLVVLFLSALFQIIFTTGQLGFWGGVIFPLIEFVFGVLLWRIFCEIVLLFFDMRDKLAIIAGRTAGGSATVPGGSRPF